MDGRWLVLMLVAFALALQTPAAANEPNVANAPSFESDILPILQSRCHACHGGNESKGGLTLESVQTMLNGAESGSVVVPGQPKQSYLLHRIRRREMPPKGREPVTKAERKLIERWIQGGMPAREKWTLPPQRDLVTDEDRQHWAYRRLRSVKPPDGSSPLKKGSDPLEGVRNKAKAGRPERVRPLFQRTASHAERVRTPIDSFVLRRLEDAELSLAKPAEPATLARRVWLDLIGIPPTPQELQTFLTDQRFDAYERLVEQLLASPMFGERWGRHWLDVAGYADTVGFDHGPTQVILSEGKWRYRDFVVDSTNADVPYDQFLRQQLAGDELVDWKNADEYSPEIVTNLIATGFLRTARDQTHESVGVITPNYYEVLHDTMEMMNRGLLGLTLQCTRCHDHKFDAFTQRDYYRIMATLMPAYNPNDWRPVFPFDEKVNDRTLPDVSPRRQREIEQHNTEIDRQIGDQRKQIESIKQLVRSLIREQRLAKLPAEERGKIKAALDTADDKRTDDQKDLAKKHAISDDDLAKQFDKTEKQRISTAEKEIASLESKRRKWQRIQALFDVGEIPTTFVLKRGEHALPSRPVKPGFLSVLCDNPRQAVMRPATVPNGSSGRRLALARWLTEPNTRVSSLVARVQVNRVWQALFGRGLVESSGDFGVQGTPPSHPELLDWLAAEFVRAGWHQKQIIRTIVTSSVYRQASAITHTNQKSKIKNPKPLDPDNRLLWRMPLRRLESESIRDSLLAISGRLDRTMGGPPVQMKAHADGRIEVDVERLARPSDRWRRSIYLVTRRGYSDTLLDVFDQPSIQTTCSRRQVSAIPLQSLTMLNDKGSFETAELLANQILASKPTDDRRTIRDLYRQVLCRSPQDRESKLCRQALDEHRAFYRNKGHDEQRANRDAIIELAHTLLNTSEFLYRE